MAIAEDASTPVTKRSASEGTATSITTAAFSPPAGSLLVAMLANNLLNAPSSQPTLSISDSASGAWTQVINRPGATSTYYCQCAAWIRYLPTAPGSITVTGNRGGTAASDTELVVRVVTGAAQTQTGAAVASNAYSGTASNATQQAITTTTPGSWVYVVSAIGNYEVPNILSTTTAIDVWSDSANSTECMFGRMTNPTTTPGSVNLGWTRSNTTKSENQVIGAFEILPAATVAPTNDFFLQ